MRCVILQPSYIPWRGYFHQLLKSDVFVFLDDVQFDRHGWRNRNRLKSPHGSCWLTIPVLSKGTRTSDIAIRDIHINWDRNWAHKHWNSICHWYARAPYFRRYADKLEAFYQRRDRRLADFTVDLTKQIAEWLGARPRYVKSSRLAVQGRKTERLVQILQCVGATHYITGPAAKSYLNESQLRAEGVSLEYMRYDYPAYPQLHGAFDGQVSMLDTLFNLGPLAARATMEPAATQRMAA